MNLESINHALLLIIVGIAIVIDWRTTKIPNLLTFPAAACGIILNFLASGWHGAAMASAGWLLAVGVTVVLGNLPFGAAAKGGGIGMGDVKLLAAVGAFLGPKSALIAIFYFCLFFGLLSCIILAGKVPWKQVGALVSAAIFDGDISGIKLDTKSLNEQRRAPLPISLAILIATVLTIYFRVQTLRFLGMN